MGVGVEVWGCGDVGGGVGRCGGMGPCEGVGVCAKRVCVGVLCKDVCGMREGVRVSSKKVRWYVRVCLCRSYMYVTIAWDVSIIVGRGNGSP